MRRGRGSNTVGLVLSLLGCEPGGARDAGLTDAGPVCVGVPARLQQEAQCVSAPASMCAASRADSLAQHPVDCDAGPGILGHVSVGRCASLESVSWVYGFPGDTVECFFRPDGGALVGSLTLSDHGILVAGEVGECQQASPPACDGG